MAKIQTEEKSSPNQKVKTEDSEKSNSEERVFKFDNLLSNVSTISSKVVTGGLDTLEGIGKKTINILHETDPNIKEKIRNINVVGSNNKPNLSDLLKEAREKSDDISEVSTASKDQYSSKLLSFEQLLDENNGLVYLEALEILSKQSKMKIELLLKPLVGSSLSEMEETLSEIEELCELPDADTFDDSFSIEKIDQQFEKAIADLNLKLNVNEIIQFTSQTNQWITEYSENNLQHIYKKSIESLARICALSLNNYQKLAELMMSLQHRSTADEADSVTQ